VGIPKPTFEYEWNSLKTTFYANKKVDEGIAGGLSGTINGGLNGTIKEVYDYIQSHQGTSAVDMENKLNIPLRTLQRWLKELKEKDLIEYCGSKKSGGYFIKPMEVKQ
jgi:ATP-dependent DNA helicase RecG